ncbi:MULTISPECIES: glycosyltransferase family 2 protein [Spongiibacter]|uniref:glycosyltransferase family 2 protein n=1 Tax=Spongiibacter TaxID=630749 RepID=UPI002355778F|nr:MULTISPECIES: glycosyltransferase family 2 protein [Spongiibacter]
MKARPFFSICVPSYNRAIHLSSLLDSIFRQNFDSYEVVICEDDSPERKSIKDIVCDYQSKYEDKIRYIENEENLGYDANIRKLVSVSKGRYCFFMGNDDIMCDRALEVVHELVRDNESIGLVLKSYAWFDEFPEKINQEVRYFKESRVLKRGLEAVSVCFRRSGVISGYIVKRDAAERIKTDEYDGSLYYQMHMTAGVLAEEDAVTCSDILVLCRNNVPPDFGNSKKEKGIYTPGAYTPEARLRMISGALDIAAAAEKKVGEGLLELIRKDYANYFYPYIKDQFNLPLKDYIALYKAFGRQGFKKYPMFHVYFVVGYLLGEEKFNWLTGIVRRVLGRSPRIGI